MFNLSLIVLFILSICCIKNGQSIRNDFDGNKCDKCMKEIEMYKKILQNVHNNLLKFTCIEYSTNDDVCDLITDSLDTILEPKSLCGSWGVCSPTNETINSPFNRIEPDCALCKMIVRLVDHVIDKQATIDIAATLDKLCNILLPSQRVKCHVFVDTHISQVIQFIEDHSDPEIVCPLIGLCKDDPDSYEKFQTIY